MQLYSKTFYIQWHNFFVVRILVTKEKLRLLLSWFYVFINELIPGFKKSTVQKLPTAWYSDILAVLEVSNFGLIYTNVLILIKFGLGDILSVKLLFGVLERKGDF